MPSTLTAAQVRAARMTSLLIDAPSQRTPLAVAQWFGAMQAQDAASGHWSIGVRSGLTEPEVVDAFERADLVRTWPMRGTIHIVPAEDVMWMLDLTGGLKLDGGSQRRREQLGITDQQLRTTHDALATALAGRKVLTRTETLSAIADAGVHVDSHRGYHLLWHAAHAGLICMGPQRGSDQTFALVSEWAPQQVQRTREDGLTELLLRFVRSHGPVPLKDFSGWTNLGLRAAKAGAEANVGRLLPVQTGAGEMWVTTELHEHIRAGDLPPHPVVALPGFDEFLLGYKDRSLQAPADVMQRVVPGNNGVFRATIVIEGAVVATWKRTLTSKRVAVDVELFRRSSAKLRADVETALQPYARFLGRALDMRFA